MLIAESSLKRVSRDALTLASLLRIKELGSAVVLFFVSKASPKAGTHNWVLLRACQTAAQQLPQRLEADARMRQELIWHVETEVPGSKGGGSLRRKVGIKRGAEACEV